MDVLATTTAPLVEIDHLSHVYRPGGADHGVARADESTLALGGGGHRVDGPQFDRPVEAGVPDGVGGGRGVRQDDPQPVPIDEHVVQMELGPDYPQAPPSVYWVTEIFHPNILPNYDSALARQYPRSRGHPLVRPREVVGLAQGVLVPVVPDAEVVGRRRDRRSSR